MTSRFQGLFPPHPFFKGKAMTPVAQASAHQSCGAKHQDGRPMLFGFLVIFTHQYRLTELCILNAENVEKVYSRPFKQMSWPKQRRLSIILTINIMQPRGMSWQVSPCFKTSVVNVLQLCGLWFREVIKQKNFLSGIEWKKRRYLQFKAFTAGRLYHAPLSCRNFHSTSLFWGMSWRVFRYF